MRTNQSFLDVCLFGGWTARYIACTRLFSVLKTMAQLQKWHRPYLCRGFKLWVGRYFAIGLPIQQHCLKIDVRQEWVWWTRKKEPMRSFRQPIAPNVRGSRLPAWLFFAIRSGHFETSSVFASCAIAILMLLEDVLIINVVFRWQGQQLHWIRPRGRVRFVQRLCLPSCVYVCTYF